jgi:hypothetical protein
VTIALSSSFSATPYGVTIMISNFLQQYHYLNTGWRFSRIKLGRLTLHHNFKDGITKMGSKCVAVAGEGG